MNIFKHKQKLLHILKRKDEHSIHSPYMFDLYNKQIKKNRKKPNKLIASLENEFGNENIIKIPSSYIEFQNIQTKITEKTILCIENPYQNKDTYMEFYKISNDPRTLVSVDLFFLGLTSQNKDLSRQHYIF
ncbi:MAG: hypothetical protein M0O93_03810 [Bacteroidales bacterium]|nr:hypothetical protein [Bacteroidales bacterium]